MKNSSYILILLLLLACNDRKKELSQESENISLLTSKKNVDSLEVIFSAYTTAKKGLKYRKEPNLDAEILGIIDYGTKIDIVDNRNRSLFWIDDEKRGGLYGKWVGIKKNNTIAYVFDGYLFKTSEKIDNNITFNYGNLEVVYSDTIAINSNQNLVVEKHIQTTNILKDYAILKLKTNKKIVDKYRVDYLLKESYALEKQQGQNQTFIYHTLFDESPSSEYKLTFKIQDNKLLKLSEDYFEADEEPS